MPHLKIRFWFSLNFFDYKKVYRIENEENEKQHINSWKSLIFQFNKFLDLQMKTTCKWGRLWGKSKFLSQLPFIHLLAPKLKKLTFFSAAYDRRGIWVLVPWRSTLWTSVWSCQWYTYVHVLWQHFTLSAPFKGKPLNMALIWDWNILQLLLLIRYAIIAIAWYLSWI